MSFEASSNHDEDSGMCGQNFPNLCGGFLQYFDFDAVEVAEDTQFDFPQQAFPLSPPPLARISEATSTGHVMIQKKEPQDNNFNTPHDSPNGIAKTPGGIKLPPSASLPKSQAAMLNSGAFYARIPFRGKRRCRTQIHHRPRQTFDGLVGQYTPLTALGDASIT